MERNNNMERDNIDVKKYYDAIVEYKNNFIVSIVLSLSVALIYLLLAQPLYESYTTLYHHDNSSSGQMNMDMGNLQGVMSLFQGGNTDSSIPFYISDIVDSRTLKENILFKVWDTKNFQNSLILLDLLVVDETDSLEKIEKGIKKLNDMFDVKVSDTGLHEISVLSFNRYLSADIANYISDYIIQYINKEVSYLNSRKRKFIENEMVSIKQTLTKSEENLMNFQKRNPMITDSPVLILEQGRLKRNVLVDQEVYLTLRQQYELAKIDEANKKAVITIIDLAKPFSKPSHPRKILIIITSLLLGIVVGLLTILITNLYAEINREKNNS